MKYVLVSGGVISGIGKGICASSTGFLLKAAGHRVTSIKIDPYLNIDAGTFSPYEHGECYVLDDGGEVDLDLGNYERFLDITLTQDNNITTGKVYRSVIEKERKGDYLGKTVQVVPHVTNEIQAWIERVARMPVDESGLEPEVCVIELGGTMGDIESAPFAEAMNAFKLRVGSENFMLVHVSLVPVIATTGESKTKPTQHSVRELRSLGMFPDVIVCRSTVPLQQEVLAKVSQFCHVEEKSVLNLHDCKSVWEVPLLMEKQNMLKVLGERLNLPKCLKERALNSSLGAKWMSMVSRLTRVREEIEIVVVGKYTGLSDTYLSITKALQHASLFCERKLELKWIEAEHLERKTLATQPVQYHDAWSKLCGASGILVPGGFGHRGTEGKIHAAQWARENKIPYLGICLGMQLAVIEFARNVMGMEDANSTEFNEATANPVVMFMPEGSKTHLGGTMRLGQRKTLFHNRDSTSFKLYGGQDFVLERHRHRYEVNPEFVDQLEAAGLLFVGRDETGERMEITELSRESHPFMMGVQYHPEYLSRPVRPSPVFIGFILAAMGDAKLSEYLDNQAGSIHRYDSHEIIKDMETADV